MTKHTVSVTFAPGGGYHGLFIPHLSNVHSVCAHNHSTESAAIKCAEKKRAQFNKGDWTMTGSRA